MSTTVRIPQCFQNTRCMQYAAAIIVTLGIPSGTIIISWCSPALPILTSSESPLGRPITTEEESWIVSIHALSSIPGAATGFLLLQRYPRKTLSLLSAIVLTLPWFAIAFAKSPLTIIIARGVVGMISGLTYVIIPVYLSEIAEKDVRGKLGTLISLLRITGSLFVLSVGPFVSYIALTLSCSAFSIVFFILLFFMPESPYFLAKVGNHDEAKINLTRLSGNQAAFEEKLDEIERTITFDMRNKSTVSELLTKQKYRKSLIIMLGIKTFQKFSGASAIDSYIQTIIKSSGSSISPEISSIICGVIQMPGVLVTTFLVDRVGRKPLWIISSLGCAVALVAEGTYFYLQDVLHHNLNSVSWLPTVALMLYLIMNPIGLYTLPFILMGELFATNIKDIAVSLMVAYGNILAFIVLKCFKPVSESWGIHIMFWIFSIVCILSALTIYFVLPETKGKTFLEIQKKLNKTG